MKTNKILIVGAAFLMMISCDNNSISHDNLENENKEISAINTGSITPLSASPTAVSYSSLLKTGHAL